MIIAATGHRPDKLGWDQAFAQAAVDLGIPYIAAVPFEGFESTWPIASQDRFYDLRDKAAEVEIVSPYPGTVAMQRRNEWMVDYADRICALWDGSWGGTFNCVRYAHRRNVPLDNLWDRWGSLV